MLDKAVKTMTPQQARDLLDAGKAMLIDVRDADEYRDEHIAYAASVPLSSVHRIGSDFRLPSGRKIILHCLSGARAGQACSTISRDFPGSEIYNLEGGINAWKEAGLPVVAGRKGGAGFPSLFRQVQVAVGGIVLACVAIGFSGYTPAFAVAGLVGGMLALAGITGWCGMALLLARMPWNRNA